MITCVGAQAAWHQFTAGINPILLWFWAHQDQFSSLDDWQPVAPPDCLRALEAGGGAGFLSPWTSEGTRGSYLHFLSLCRGTLPGMADLINASVIHLPPLKLLSCCWSESCTVTPLRAAPASKLPSTVILSHRTWRQGKRCFDLEDVYISSWESWPQMSLNLTNFHFTILSVVPNSWKPWSIRDHVASAHGIG